MHFLEEKTNVILPISTQVAVVLILLKKWYYKIALPNSILNQVINKKLVLSS